MPAKKPPPKPTRRPPPRAAGGRPAAPEKRPAASSRPADAKETKRPPRPSAAADAQRPPRPAVAGEKRPPAGDVAAPAPLKAKGPKPPRAPKGPLLRPVALADKPPPPSKPDTDRPLQQYGVFSGLDPISGWTVDVLADALGGHARGRFDLSGRLAEAMAAHPWIRHALEIRSDAWVTLPLNVTPTKLRGDGRRCADFVREVFPEILPLAVLRDLHKMFLLMGFAIAGIDWEERTDGKDRWWLPIVKPWIPQLTAYRAFMDPNSVDGGAFIAQTLSQGLLKVEPGGGRWLLFTSGKIKPWLNGAVMTLGESFIGDGYNFRDNMTHQDRYGRGIMKLFHPVSWKDEEVLVAANSLRDGGGGGVLPCARDHQGNDLVDLKVERADAAGYQTFDATEKRILRRILVTLLGQDMTSIGQTGGYRQAVVHKEVLWHKREHDAATFGDARAMTRVDDRGQNRATIREWGPADNVLRSQLWWWLAHWNFGSGDLAPYTWWDATPPDSMTDDALQAAERSERQARALAALAGAVDKLGGVQNVDVDYLAEQIGLHLRRPADNPQRDR